MHLDQVRQQAALEKLLCGVETMGPEAIVLVGEFLSPESRCEGYQKLKESLDFLLYVVREKELTHL